MWRAEQTVTRAEKILQYVIFDQKKQLSFEEVFLAWKENADFRAFYSHTLQATPFEAFFWEHPPVSKRNLSDSYEFVLVQSNLLTSIKPEPKAFAAYFDKAALVSTFPNLGGDAQLITPSPISAESPYSHMARFINQAPSVQLDAFWQRVGEQMLRAVGHTPKWLSTAGLGVYWLHVRIDSRPKYYRYQPYKQEK